MICLGSKAWCNRVELLWLDYQVRAFQLLDKKRYTMSQFYIQSYHQWVLMEGERVVQSHDAGVPIELHGTPPEWWNALSDLLMPLKREQGRRPLLLAVIPELHGCLVSHLALLGTETKLTIVHLDLTGNLSYPILWFLKERKNVFDTDTFLNLN